MINGEPYTSRGVRTVREGVPHVGGLPHDSMIFLGGKEKTTLKELTETLGKETIDTYNTGDSRGSQRSYSLNYQKLGKELL